MDLEASTRFRRRRSSVPSARSFVDHALVSAAVPRPVIDRLVLAMAEASNNAILHADGDTFTVSVEVADSTCTLTVSDVGAGFDPPARPRMPEPDTVGQRGLALMEALVDRVEVSSSPAGTTVVLEHDVTPAAASLASSRVGATRSGRSRRRDAG
ncbi:MAG TPA: ATP-binding protein [Acidimicrobiales bacterium]|nr:ATP-binding protein [Acidimicrobiales bacterium]